MDKKAQAPTISNMGAIILTLGIAGILVSILAAVLTGTNDSLDTSDTVTILNLNVTAPGSATNTSMGAPNINTDGIIVVNRTAAMSGAEINVHIVDTKANGGECDEFVEVHRVWRCGNFSLYLVPGVFSVNDTSMDDDVLTFNYTHETPNDLAEVTNSTEAGIINISAQFPLLGTIVILLIVLGVVLTVLGVRSLRQRGNGGEII